jgi:hypothetical protein
VQIEYRTTGGPAYFPGLAVPITFDTAELPAERRTTLERLVEEARFFDQSADTAPERGADYQIHTITVRDGSRTHTVRRADPVSDSALSALVDALRQLRLESLRAKRVRKVD